MGVKIAKQIENTKDVKVRLGASKSSTTNEFEMNNQQKSDNLLSSDCREELIIQNRARARKLARSILRKWHSRIDVEEVDSIVDLSLCEAAQRYNPNMGAGFMTFLFYHLRGNLIRTITIAASANMIPVSEVNPMLEGGSEKNHRRNVVLTNAIEVADALTGNETLAPDIALEKKELVNLSQQACSSLDYLEREVIERIYMNGEQLLDVAYNLGYSRCHISRIKRKALEALYDGMAILAGPDTLGQRPNFDEDEDVSEARRIHRKLTTRRPRSKKAQNMYVQALRA
ncbi:MAG: sigma-70 family RNA polymerase sigma factor [SAR324 cluster bacterium]|uniref:Sigma-70 family RNA polymerase sigma factor n=1 Tax=SAR324 cluster bacterium TaxID=2024889 RepID=A0A7X9IKK0_9DELT|nr:sigma-70 family RNA polymerase sigma factor [SAR324 cluster bacterium]